MSTIDTTPRTTPNQIDIDGWAQVRYYDDGPQVGDTVLLESEREVQYLGEPEPEIEVQRRRVRVLEVGTHWAHQPLGQSGWWVRLGTV